jgi:hypothetical protein
VQVESDPQAMVQTPLVQTSAPVQAVPQDPQLALSVSVFAQYGEPVDGVQVVSAPQVIVQTPFEQTLAPVQALPQEPQFALSVVVLAQ